ncbi:MAG: protein kinase, partial [Gemmataceae bacterium]|nr:protein kinase [Gemmataceae bacterium]
MRDCPPAEQLEQLLAARLGPVEQDALARHLEGCAACQDRLEDLTSDADPGSWHGLGDRLDPAHEPPADFLTHLQTVLSSPHPAGEYQPGLRAGSFLQQPPGALPAVPGYVIVGELGCGGMGIVYKARQVRLNRLVALKMLRAGAHAGPKELDRFRREAEAVACLHHPQIVQIYEVGESEGRPYLALELVEGGSLAQYLVGKPQPARLAAAFLETLARAVHYAHQQGILHRDLKPANILLASVGQTGQPDQQESQAGQPDRRHPLAACTPKISDFGLAKRLAGEAAGGPTHSGQILGTPSYMAPEQATPTRFPAGQEKRAGVTAAADVYSLGAILYELLTGRPPFVGETALDTVLHLLHEEPVSLCRLQPNLPRDLETITLKCLHKDPARRYLSAEALAEDLRRYLAGEPIRARPAPLWERAWKWAWRHPAGAAVVAGVILCTALSFGLLIQTRQRAEAEARARRAAERQQASLLIDRDLALCEQGEVSQGLLGLAQTLVTVPIDATDLQHVIRMNLAAWRYRLISPRQALLHTNLVVAATFSPDGRTLVTGSSDKVARLWDVATGQPLGFSLTHKGEVRVVAFSPDGQSVLTGSEDRTARLWDARTGQPLGPPLVHEGAVVALAFSPDGRAVLTGSKDHTARLWDVATGRLVGEPLEHQHEVAAVAFSPDSRLLLTGSLDHRARLWEMTASGPGGKRTPVGRFTLPHEGGIQALAFSPDGRLAATGSEDGTACLWDPATGQRRRQPLRHAYPVWALAFSPDGKILLTGSGLVGKRQGDVRLWDVATGQSLVALPHNSRVQHVAFSPVGAYFLSLGEDTKAKLWLTGGDRPIGTPLTHGEMVCAVAFSPDGRTFATAGKDVHSPSQVGRVRFWATPVDQTKGISLPHAEPMVLAVAFSPDGRTVATSTGSPKAETRLWDASTGHPRGGPLAHGASVWAVAFSPDGTKLLTGSSDRTARLWDAATGQLIGAPWSHPGELRAVAFSPDGRAAVTGGYFDTALLWDVATGQRLPVALGHDAFVRAVAFSPDGQSVLTGSLDGAARLWDAATGQPRGAPLWHQQQIRHVAFGPDGRIAVTCSFEKMAQLWDVLSARPLNRPLVHHEFVTGVAFSPDGRLLATACAGDGMARLWEVATAKPVGAPLPRPARAVAFRPDGRCLITGGLDGTARFWEVPAPAVGDPEQRTVANRVTVSFRDGAQAESSVEVPLG